MTGKIPEELRPTVFSKEYIEAGKLPNFFGLEPRDFSSFTRKCIGDEQFVRKTERFE